MDQTGFEQGNDIHTRLSQVAALLKVLRLANVIHAHATEHYLPGEDGSPVTRQECEAVLFVVERTLGLAQRQLQRLLPYQDPLAAWERVLNAVHEQERLRQTFCQQFGEPVAGGEEGRS